LKLPTLFVELRSKEGPTPYEKQDLLLSVFIALLNIGILLTLFILRSNDDNRLTSWAWVFADFSPLKLFIILAMGTFAAYPLSRFFLSERMGLYLLPVSAFLVAALFWQQPEVIVDASRYFIQAKLLELNGPLYFLQEWGNAVPAWTDMPLVPFVYGLIFRVFGESRILIQAFTALLFSGTLVLTYLIGKTLWNKQIGLYASGLLLGIPYLFTQLPLFMVDVATMFFLTLAIYALIKAIDTGNLVHCLYASLAITLALLAKYSNWLLFSVIPIIFLEHFRHGWKDLARKGSIIATGVFVLMGLYLLIYFDVIIEQLRLLRSFQIPALGAWSESHVSTFFFQVHPFVSIAAIFSLYRAAARKDFKFLIVCSMVVLALLLDVKRIRYLVVMFPMLALMSAYGLDALRNVEVKKFVVACTATSAILIAALAYLPFLERTSAVNIARAGEYLDSVSADNVGVYVLSQPRSSINPSVAVPILDLFTSRKLSYPRAGIPQGDMGRIERLPLRWTWALDSPQYSNGQLAEDGEYGIIVIIQGEVDQRLPEDMADKLVNYHLQKEFDVADNVFRFQTIIRIFQRNENETGEDSS